MERSWNYVAGGRASRTYRRAYRPPNGLRRNFDVLVRFDGKHIGVDSFLLAVIRAGGNNSYPYSAGGYEFLESKVFRRESSPKGTPHAFKGRRKFSTT